MEIKLFDLFMLPVFIIQFFKYFGHVGSHFDWLVLVFVERLQTALQIGTELFQDDGLLEDHLFSVLRCFVPDFEVQETLVTRHEVD